MIHPVAGHGLEVTIFEFLVRLLTTLDRLQDHHLAFQVFNLEYAASRWTPSKEKKFERPQQL